MTKFVKVPAELFAKLEAIWTEISGAARLEEQQPPVLPVPNTEEPADLPGNPLDFEPETIIWVDPNQGHDSNDGMTAASSIKTWARVHQMLEPGALVMLRPGIYRQAFALANGGGTKEKPIYFKSELPGQAVFSGFRSDMGGWKAHGNGVYKKALGSSAEQPWCGFAKNRFLPRWKSLQDLTESRVGNFRMPKYGFCVEKGTLYVRIPGNADPNKELTYLTEKWAETRMIFRNCPWTILDGIRFQGHGATRAVQFDEKSHHAWVQNCLFEHGREGVSLADDSVLTWNQYGYPGFVGWMTEVVQMNGGSVLPVFEYVKKYNHADGNKGNALYEGRITTSASADRSAKGLRSSYNLCSGCFDAYSLGQFEDSTSYRDAAAYALDDAYELESWRKTHSSARLKVIEPLVVNCSVGFSHQDTVGQMRGPHTIVKAVVFNPDPAICPPYLIKNLTRDLDIENIDVVYDHCFFHNPAGPNVWGQNVNFLYLDHVKGRNINLTIKNSVVWVDKIDDWDKGWNPNCDYNVLVCPQDYPHIRGPNGLWFKSIDALKLVGHSEEMMDFRPTSDSPHLKKASDGLAVGPFEPGQKLEYRSLDTEFTKQVPKFWLDR